MFPKGAWEQVKVSLSSDARTFVLEGERGGYDEPAGDGNQGDITVDHITVDTGACDSE